MKRENRHSRVKISSLVKWFAFECNIKTEWETENRVTVKVLRTTINTVWKAVVDIPPNKITKSVRWIDKRNETRTKL